MSHDLHAAWATTELSRIFHHSPVLIFPTETIPENYDIFSNREPGRRWPIPDGRISASFDNTNYEIAIEFKRDNEGLHGLLTAIGQAEAYIHKGYSSAIIVIPDSYDGFRDPGSYISSVLGTVGCAAQIGVYTYNEPDPNRPSPFEGRLTCIQGINLLNSERVVPGNYLQAHRSETQWAHLREGSSEAFAFFKYLQYAKKLVINERAEILFDNYPTELISAVSRITTQNPLYYLSNSSGDSFLDITWRNFWFEMVLTPQVSIPWTRETTDYLPHNVPTELLLSDGTHQNFFCGRVDSIKSKIIVQLNDEEIDENQAWEEFAKNIHSRAHSYREDIDSGLSHLGLLEDDGKPTELGYRLVDSCERSGDCFTGKPYMMLGAAILKNGDLAPFLHYIYKLSEDAFSRDPLRFTTTQNERKRFDKHSYLSYIRTELASNLQVMNTSASRGGQTREFFQGEFAILRKFKMIDKFRIGVGLVINWPMIQKFLDYQL